MLEVTDYLLLAAVAVVGGAVNALAGGGTLLTFPMLTAVGVPALAANITNSVALCPGYLGGALSQWRDLDGQRARLRLLLPLGVAGGIAGGWLLLQTGEERFRALVPWLILGASLLLALQEPLRRWLLARGSRHATGRHTESWASLPIALAAVYGGYFGAGLGVIMLATLAITLDDTLTRLNAVKQCLSLVINISAVVYFLFSDQVIWSVAGVMAVAALVGGTFGGRIAGRIQASTLRHVVVGIGCLVSAIYFLN